MKCTVGAYLVVTLAAFHAGATGTGRIEGVVYNGSEPAANAKVFIMDEDSIFPESPDRSRYNADAVTDEDGRFVFENVPRGEKRVGRFVESEQRTVKGHLPWWELSHYHVVLVEGGDVHHVQIGGKGRDVVGRMVLEGGADEVNFLGTSERRLWRDRAKAPVPEGLTLDEQKAWFDDWVTSPEGRAWRDEQTMIVVQVEEDGSFRIPDVPAGDWKLFIAVGKKNDSRTHPPYGHVAKNFTAPEIGDGETREPLDLGEVPIIIRDQTDSSE